MNLFAVRENGPAMRCVVAVVVLAFTMVGRLSAADDPAAIQAKMKAAQAAVQSFRMQISAPGTTGVATIFNNPTNRMYRRNASRELSRSSNPAASNVPS